MIQTENLQLVAEWDKTFPKSDVIDHQKVTFPNRYGITLAADLYTLWCGEGAVLRSLCPDARRAWFHHLGFRPELHWRERRPAPLHGLARHQH